MATRPKSNHFMSGNPATMSDVTQQIALITAPSLDPSVNVSGVSSVVRGIVDSCIGREWDFRTEIIGKSDTRRRGFAWALEQIGVPFCFLGALSRHRPHLIHINGPLNTLAVLRDFLLIILARIYTRNVVYHIHGGSYVSAAPSSKLIKQIITSLLSFPALILVLGEQEAERIISLYGVDEKFVRVLPNAVATHNIVPKRVSSPPLNVLSLGRISPEKGLAVLCETFEVHPELRNDVMLHMYGAGPQTQEVLGRLESSLGSSFVFGGVAKNERRDAAYAWADILILPSLRGEGLPMVLLEAMSWGVVPIATNDGLIANVIADAETGYLIEKNSQSDIYSALQKAVGAKASGALEHMSLRARNNILQNHSMQTYTTLLFQYYEYAQSLGDSR